MNRPPKNWSIERIKGSGPGGQHRNKRETGVRIRDAETGLVSTSTTRRSQQQNLKAASQALNEKIEKKRRKKKKRVATKPTRASKERRLEAKRVRSGAKSRRGRVPLD